MASEELNKMTVITDLSNQAIQEYDGLQRKHATATMECKRLEEERDEAIKKLNEFHQVSQMVIEEVSAIQENLEIERMCRGSAEALASKLQRQNVCLKRQSMLLLSQLGPQTLTEISLDQEEDTTDLCSSTLCQNNIQELQSQLELTLKEKNQAVTDLETAREQLSETREELLREKDNNTAMIAETVRQRKILGKYNRVSQFAVEEFEALQDALNLETDLRTEAEKFARVMLLEQKQLKRQSHILMQSSSPGPALQEALSQVSALTQELEDLRLQHHSQMEQMDSRLGSSEDQSQLKALTIKLELLEEEKDQYSHQWSKAQVDIKDLRYTVEELQKKLQTATNPPPAPAPPPPPPPPPLPAPSPPASNPLSSLLSLIRKRRDISGDIPLVAQDSGQTPELDVRQQAVDEMMQRIKKGVQLRPVGQSPNRRQVERRPSNSAYQELKGIMESFNRASPQPKTVSPATSRDEELRSILLRRRGALDS